MSSLSIANSTFRSVVQELPSGIMSRAQEFEAFQRSRKVENAAELMRAVMLYCGLDYSLREVAANFTRMGNRLSDEAVRKRLSGCEKWLEAMLREMLPVREKEVKAGVQRLILIDGTTIQAPGARTTDYRVHLGWDCIEQKFVHSMVTDKRTPESLKLYEWQSGDVVIADAAYATAQQLMPVKEKGAEYIVRCAAANIRLFSEEDKRLDVVKELRRQECKSIVSFRVWIKSEDTMQPAYLHAFRLPEEAAAEVRVRIRKRSMKRGTKTKAETIYLAGWMLLLTSIEPEMMSAEIVAKLYRSRWQIEMVIKRLKSLLKIDALRAKRGSRLARVYLLGKIIYALIVEKRAMIAAPDRIAEWRVWKIVAEQLRPKITLSTFQPAVIEPDALKVLKERSRKRHRLRDTISAIFQINQQGQSFCLSWR
jgi:Transposase DDE domain